MKPKTIYAIAACGLLIAASSASGRDISNYINWGPSTHNLPAALKDWKPGEKLCDDDNFFISRVRPKARFVNTRTQVHPEIVPEADKNLIYWVPAGTPPHNALPSDRFDADVFSMWSYVTHFGNWSAPLARIPGNFADAAHKNGVGVSPVAGIPWGALSEEWGLTLRDLLAIGPQKMADFLCYYGIDGIGYNSEFSIYNNQAATDRPKSVSEIAEFNAELTRISKEKGNPLFTNIWYDGTAIDGNILFDQGLGNHNFDTFGREESPASSLFFNYNWNNESLLRYSVNNAKKIGRNPLDIYAGFNMQGGEPSKTDESWTLLKNFPISIGLWGAHSESMMYESRREMGTSPSAIQRNYLLRTEWWFSGGTRNPASAPEISDKWNYSGQNTEFFGMARLMSARSALTEPFVTSFNLGNGSFFNYKGLRRSDSEWSNIGLQDILPTWRFWWSTKLLGGSRADVASQGLDASFCWDDAWLGGSSLRISGSTSSPEYLHLFKTDIEVSDDQTIFLRYKLLEGSGQMRIVLTAKGAEKEEIELPLSLQLQATPSEEWHETRFRIADVAPQLCGSNLALIALRYDSASDLNMLLGGFGIIGSESATPQTPLVSTTELLYAGTDGADGKIIWEMPDGERLRYNEDQNVSFFQLYAQQEGCEPVLQSGTSSWAGLLLGVGIDHSKPTNMRFGVAAVSGDFSSESEIAWGDWHDLMTDYQVSDALTFSHTEFYVNRPIEIAFEDPNHAEAEWKIFDASGECQMSTDAATEITFTPSLVGLYSLSVSYSDKGGKQHTDTYDNCFEIISGDKATAPHITDFSWEPTSENSFDFAYTATRSSGQRCRALAMTGNPFGIAASELGYKEGDDFSIAFWIKPNAYHDEETHLLSIRDKTDSWANNEWGWLWSTIGEGGRGVTVSLRRSVNNGNMEIHFPDVYLAPEVWSHIAFSFDYDETGAMTFNLLVNGKRVAAKSYYEGMIPRRGEPGPISQLYRWREKNIISVGGTLFKAGGVEGAIDNFTYWTIPLDEESVRAACDFFDVGEPFYGLGALYSFDSPKEGEPFFTNEIFTPAITLDAKAGTFRFIPQQHEGSGVMQFVEPTFCAGPSKLIGGSTTTEVIWEAPGASDFSSTGNELTGSAHATYTSDGIYKVVLTLRNLCGSDSREITMIEVPATNGVAAVESAADAMTRMLTIAPRGIVAVRFAEPGGYVVRVCTLDGREVMVKEIQTEGEAVTLEGLPASTPLMVRISNTTSGK